jgi:hypothetical protein
MPIFPGKTGRMLYDFCLRDIRINQVGLQEGSTVRRSSEHDEKGQRQVETQAGARSAEERPDSGCPEVITSNQ